MSLFVWGRGPLSVRKGGGQALSRVHFWILLLATFPHTRGHTQDPFRQLSAYSTHTIYLSNNLRTSPPQQALSRLIRIVHINDLALYPVHRHLETLTHTLSCYTSPPKGSSDSLRRDLPASAPLFEHLSLVQPSSSRGGYLET